MKSQHAVHPGERREEAAPGRHPGLPLVVWQAPGDSAQRPQGLRGGSEDSGLGGLSGAGLPTSRARRAARLRDLVDVDADHRLAEAAGDLGDHVRVVEEGGGGLDDGLGALGGVAGP